MALKTKNLGGILGILGLIVWAGSIFLNIPSFLGNENRINIFIDYVTNLSVENYILPVAFILFAVFSVIKNQLFALICGVAAAAMSIWVVYNGNDSTGNIIAAVIGVACAVAAFLKKN